MSLRRSPTSCLGHAMTVQGWRPQWSTSAPVTRSWCGSFDRLGRNLWHILQTVKKLTERGVTLVSVTDGIDSSTAAGRMMIGVLGSLAEYERELTKERTALKRASSRANGTKFGRPRKVDDADYIATARRMKADGHTASRRGARGPVVPPWPWCSRRT